MTLKKCKMCGEPLNRREGNYYVCDFCGNKWEIDSSNDVHAVERANAWIALQGSDFERATELFDEIIHKEPENHEAYWGRALATGAILYVTDLSEDKKVPTCNNISEESFINGKDVQKAISFAPADIAETYKKQSEQIEKIRIEWLEKARKEPAYDVFICYKDSDRENGLERTQDSIDAQDLYNALVAEGYKVFFSRISLRDKVAEQYEPYIYNAIRTAKVMIVFGEKPEYFRAVWLKNEWSRFKTRIEKGEKHKNSLVVVYKNMDPGELPVVLKSRQCLNAADMTFLSDLNRHIKKVIEASQQATRLEKIKIEGGQIAKKATTISGNTIQTRDVGKGAIAETSISEQQTLSLANTYLTAKQWDDAKSLVDDVLFNNPSYAEAIWCQILINHKVSNNEELLNKLNSLREDEYKIIEKVLNCADKEYAGKILNYLYDSESNANVSEGTYRNILNLILPYNFAARDKKIQAAFNNAIEKGYFAIFNILLATLESNDVDRYIKYNYEFAKRAVSKDIKIECINRILKVNEGNSDALDMLFEIQLINASATDLIKTFEEILKYSPNPNKRIEQTLDYFIGNLSDNRHSVFAKQLLKYYTEDLGNLKDRLIKLAYRMINKSFFDDAQYILNLALTFDPNNSDIFWGICLIKTKSVSEDKIVGSPILLKSVPEFNKYLTLVDEQRRLVCISLAKQQEEIVKKQEREREETERRQELERQARERQQARMREEAERRKAIRKKRKKVIASVASALVVAVLAILTGVTIIIRNDIKARAGLQYTLSEDGTYYIVSGVKNSLSEHTVPESYKGIPVTKIGADAFKNSKATSITIPDSITNIAGGAFSGCSNLESLTIPFVGDSVKTSENTYQYPFGYIFGTNSFTGGEITKQYYYGDNINNVTSTFYYIPSTLKYVKVTGGNILYGAFGGCSNLKSITIPDTVTSIGESSFHNCTSLESITIPDGVIRINYGAFSDCTSLKAVYINDIESWCKISFGSSTANPLIYAHNLYSKGNLVTELEIPESMTSISESAFSGCTSIETVYWNAINCTKVSFKDCKALKTVIIGENVKAIPTRVFAGCTGLETVYWNATDCIWSRSYFFDAEFLFEGCTALSTVIIGENVETIHSHTFASCTSLETVYWNATNCTSAGYYGDYNDYYVGIFEDCTALTTVKIGENVQTIPGAAFSRCENLESVTIGNNITSIGDYTFAGCININAVYIQDIESWCKISFGNSSANPLYYAHNLYLIGKLVTELEIPDGITSIGDYAFYSCASLKSITLPDSVTSIGTSAFYRCTSLGNITFPDGVTNIGYEAFSGCTSLESIVIPGGVTEIGGYAFEDCTSITTVIIPDSVTSIRVSFAGCTSLKEVYYGGTAQQWNDIIIYGDARGNERYLMNATRYYYVENEADVPDDSGNYWHYVDGKVVVWVKED